MKNQFETDSKHWLMSDVPCMVVKILDHCKLDIFGEMANAAITKCIQQVTSKYREGIHVDTCLAYPRLTIMPTLYICLSLLRRISRQRQRIRKFSCRCRIHQFGFGGSWQRGRDCIPWCVSEGVSETWSACLQNRFNKGKPEWIADHGCPRHACSTWYVGKRNIGCDPLPSMFSKEMQSILLQPWCLELRRARWVPSARGSEHT